MLGAVSAFALGPLVPIDGTLHSGGYIKLLEKFFKPFMERAQGQSDQKLRWLQDHASIHESHFSECLMKTWGWELAEHPVRSPDLNCIEFVWLVVMSLIRQRRPRSRHDLLCALDEFWPLAADPSQFHHYLAAMEQNVLQVVEKKGGNHYQENRFRKAIM